MFKKVFYKSVLSVLTIFVLLIFVFVLLPINVSGQETKTPKSFLVNISWNLDKYPDAPTFTPNKKMTVLDTDGPGMLTNLHFSAYRPAKAGSMSSGAALWLTVFYDNENKPAIDMPLMDFLGDVDCQAAPYATVYFSKVKQSHNFYLKMPFKKHIKVEIENRSDVELMGYGTIQVQPINLQNASINDLHELRVDYRVGRETVPENMIELLNVNRGGEIVAHWLQLDSDEKLCENGEYMCEGNDEFYLDGEEKPSLEYFGTEDLYGYSWGFQGLQSDGKSAIIRRDNKKGGGAIIGMLRCREIDKIPFDKSCKLLINYRHEAFSSYAKNPLHKLPKSSFKVNYKSCIYYYAKGKDSSVTAVEGLVSRRIPDLKTKVEFEQIPNAENNADVFELQTRNGKLIVRGNNGVSMASGLNWYLKHYCNCQITLRSQQLNIPQILPEIKETLRIVSPHQYRYYFNYCCFSYTLAFWDWNDWEKMIDLMALYGVNAPLSVTGQEGVWLNVGKRLGLSEEQMQEFFVGPAFLPFGWMGCIDKWAGPLPKTWIAEHVELEKKILKRERAFGMTPILQGFTGHVPKTLQDINKEVKLVKLTSWCNFPSTYFIDPTTPFFQEVGKIWVEEQTKLFGTNHLYASDTFIEMLPPSNNPDTLRRMGEAIYGGMKAADPDAIWVLQGWLFISWQSHFWQKPQREAFLRSVPQGKLLVIDLQCEDYPVWSKTEAFSGQPWIWAIVQNFGGSVSLHGAIDRMSADLNKSIQQRGKESGKLSGIGYIMEGLGWNPLIDEWQSEMVWRKEIPETNNWIKQFVNRRYGKENAKAQEAWQILYQTAYQQIERRDNAIGYRPRLKIADKEWRSDVLGLRANTLPACKVLLEAAAELGGERTYRFDVVNITREVIGSLAAKRYREILAAYEKKDRQQLKTAADRMNALIFDLDRLLACDDQFLLGTWLENAKRWGRDNSQKDHYEWNARTLISLWGEPKNGLNDYARKQWSGMFSDYYARRWNLFYRELDKSLENKTAYDADAFDKKIYAFQIEWGKEKKSFPTVASGENPIAVAKELLAKYEDEF